MLLDDILPAYHYREAHAIWIHAPPNHVYRMLKQLTPGEAPLFRWLMGLRVLPARLAGRNAPLFSLREPLFAQFVQTGFAVLADAPDREVVLGRVAEFWRLWGGRAAPMESSDAFIAFWEPGYAKAAVNFFLQPEGAGTRVHTETRVQATDRAARAKFAVYWGVIQLGSAAIRRSWLAALKRRAESDTAGTDREAR